MIYKLYEKLSNELRKKEKQDLTKNYAVYKISHWESISINAVSMVETTLQCDKNDDIDDFVQNVFEDSFFRKYKRKKLNKNTYRITHGIDNWTITKLKDKGE